MELLKKNEAVAIGLKYYFTGKPCKHGHVSKRMVRNSGCFECKVESRVSDGAKYRENHKSEISEYRRKYDSDNKASITLNKRDYRKNNPMQIFARCSLQRIEKAIGGCRVERAEKSLGYTKTEFKEHIESMFLDGMTWDNRSEWHIDHILPLKRFIDAGERRLSVINALSNLQPLWAYDNQSNGCKVLI